jgi:hypothetical protein
MLGILKRIERFIFGSYVDDSDEDLICTTYHKCIRKPKFDLNFKNVNERDYIIYRY